MRMPADWWDSPTAVGCPLSRGPQSARAARRLTRSTLRDWGLAFLAEDAEAIVGEFVANAVTHAAAVAAVPTPRRQSPDGLGLRLLRRNGEVICAVLDPSDSAPVLKAPATTAPSVFSYRHVQGIVPRLPSHCSVMLSRQARVTPDDRSLAA